MLRLYKAGNSICSQKVLMTLDEKGIDFDTYEINLFNNEQYDPEYLKLNPKGVVPTLDHDGSIIIELHSFVSTLTKCFRCRGLCHKSLIKDRNFGFGVRRLTRAYSRQLELSFSAMFREKMKNMSQEQREARFQNVETLSVARGISQLF